MRVRVAPPPNWVTRRSSGMPGVSTQRVTSMPMPMSGLRRCRRRPWRAESDFFLDGEGDVDFAVVVL